MMVILSEHGLYLSGEEKPPIVGYSGVRDGEKEEYLSSIYSNAFCFNDLPILSIFIQIN